MWWSLLMLRKVKIRFLYLSCQCWINTNNAQDHLFRNTKLLFVFNLFFIVDLKMWSLILMASMIQSRIVCNWLCRWLQTKRKTICNFRFCIIFEPNILSNVRITKNQAMMRWDFNNHLIKYKTCVILNTVGGIEANWIKMWMLKMHLSHVLLRHIHF